jgi:DNA-binding response OmpR family regulator
MKILIIEDDLKACEVDNSILTEVNAEITVCHTPKKALHLLVQNQPDIVLLDLEFLKKTSGERILGFIYNDPRLANTQVIVINGDAPLPPG